MNDLWLLCFVVLYVLFFFVMVYLCIIADPAKSPAARFLTVEMPLGLVNLLDRIIPRRFSLALSIAYNEVVQKPNPALQIVYLVIVLGSWSIMFFYGYPFIPNRYVGGWHKISGYVLFVLSLGSWKMACRVSPGYINSQNMSRFDNYPYDELLFTNRICPTVGIRKLARSKFDRMTRGHVARFDHFCAWVNNAVGEENYRIFLAFLVVHFFMCCYGSVVTALIFWNEVVDRNLLRVTFIDMATGSEVKATKMVVTHFLIMHHPQLAAILLLMVVMALCLGLFLSFHIYLVCRGMTTNEFYKWRAVKKYHKKRKNLYEHALKEGRAGAPRVSSSLVPAPAAAWGSGESSPNVGESVAERSTARENQDGIPESVGKDMDVGCTEAGEVEVILSSEERKESSSTSVTLAKDKNVDGFKTEVEEGQERRANTYQATVGKNEDTSADALHGKAEHGPEQSGNSSHDPKEDERKEQTKLVQDPGPMPKNIYDLGIVENFKEVFFPRSLRPVDQREWKVGAIGQSWHCFKNGKPSGRKEKDD